MTTIEEARVAGIERFRALVVQEWTHRHLEALSATVNGRDSAGAKWLRDATNRASAQTSVAKDLLAEVLGISYRDLQAVANDAKEAGIAKADDMARARGWLPALEAVA